MTPFLCLSIPKDCFSFLTKIGFKAFWKCSVVSVFAQANSVHFYLNKRILIDKYNSPLILNEVFLSLYNFCHTKIESKHQE